MVTAAMMWLFWWVKVLNDSGRRSLLGFHCSDFIATNREAEAVDELPACQRLGGQ
jgi:hypothetical protein